ncbi:MAG TPA: hypothetical protein IAD04_00410 [Candidatus Caccosoma faecigallinarum]|uniref:Uncharacterized protein n=1 Tax=Candidatus Caccosoma faecigallinarum TaxID=2840720 RepID=A0A9D1G8R1_9FIRM|nr:putative uncharacterized protein [Firmicutes bacterium CAG:631]HIT16833.1 hypothetical protein [Candidatus Caccosoma faecigallinarum]
MLFDITPTRNFNLLYIILDSIFILFLLIMLVVKKRYFTTLFALFGGVLYFIVDFGYFYLLSHSRQIMIDDVIQNDLVTGLILFWMSMSYGITNFAFIWLCLRKDKHLKNWLMLIIGWWLMVPLIASLGGPNNIQTFRTTNQYHSYMAILLVIGYGGLLIYNLLTKKKQIQLLWLNLIGISVQFSWEFALLIHGIRPMNGNSISTIIVNSLLETNLGMPYIFLIFLCINRYISEDLKKVNQ